MKRHGPGVEASKLSRKKRTSSMPRSGVEPCLAAAQKAEAEAAKHRPTAEQKQARIAELEERATKDVRRLCVRGGMVPLRARFFSP